MFPMSEVALYISYERGSPIFRVNVPLDDDHLGVRNGSNVTEHENAPASRRPGRFHDPEVARLLLVIPWRLGFGF